MDSARQTETAAATPPVQTSGRLFVVSGPSGVGKGTLVNALLAGSGPGLVRSVSCTTRPPRPGERDGVDYFFITPAEFTRRVEGSEFLEHATYGSHSYGTPRRYLEEMLAKGQDFVLVIEVQGALQVRHHRPDAVFIFIRPPSRDELAQRLLGRASESPEDIEERLRIARQEMRHLWHYDYQVVNDQVESAVQRLQAILVAERCRIRGRLEEGDILPP